MNIVRNTVNVIRNVLDSPTTEIDQSEMTIKLEQSTATRGNMRHATHSQDESPSQFCRENRMDDVAETSASKRRKKLKNQRQNQRVYRPHSLLEQEHEEVFRRRQELRRDHQQLRRDHQKLREKHQDLRRDHQQLHREQQDLHRAHQDLNRVNQELEYFHGEMKQEIAILESESKELEEVLKQERIEFGGEKQTLEAYVNHFQNMSNCILEKVIRPYADERGLTYNKNDTASINVVLEPLIQDALQTRALQNHIKNLSAQSQESQAETKVLRHQIRELQKEMLSKVEKVQAISDEQFAQEFRTLRAHVKSLSRSVRPSRDVNLFRVLGSGVLFLKISRYHWKVPVNRKYLIEMWIWSTLLEMVFATPFSVYDDANRSWGKNWEALYGNGHEGELPCPTTSSESYKCIVLGELVRQAGRESIIQGQGEAYLHSTRGTHHLATKVLECRNKVANTIGTKLATISSAVDVSLIPTIVDRAFALSLDMSLQKCRLQLRYPAIGATFQESSMAALPDFDGEDVDDAVVAFIVNPGLRKWGDAHGKMLDQHYDMVPSLVQLQLREETVGSKP